MVNKFDKEDKAGKWTGGSSSLSPCSCFNSSAPDDCVIGPVALGSWLSRWGRGAASGPVPPKPSQPLGGELCSGCKIRSGGYISAMKYGCKPCVRVCLTVYVHPRKVNWRSTLTLPPQAWLRSNAGKAAAVSLTHSPSYPSLCALPRQPPLLASVTVVCVQITCREPCGMYLC